MARTPIARLPHGCIELVLGSLGKDPIAADLGLFTVIFSFYVESGMLCVLIRIASMRRF